MNSEFLVSDMSDSRPSESAAEEPRPRPTFRKCATDGCSKRMADIQRDAHTVCTNCREQVCDVNLVCVECKDWTPEQRKVFISHTKGNTRKREYNQRQRDQKRGGVHRLSESSDSESVPSVREPSIELVDSPQTLEVGNDIVAQLLARIQRLEEDKPRPAQDSVFVKISDRPSFEKPRPAQDSAFVNISDRPSVDQQLGGFSGGPDPSNLIDFSVPVPNPIHPQVSSGLGVSPSDEGLRPPFAPASEEVDRSLLIFQLQEIHDQWHSIIASGETPSLHLSNRFMLLKKRLQSLPPSPVTMSATAQHPPAVPPPARPRPQDSLGCESAREATTARASLSQKRQASFDEVEARPSTSKDYQEPKRPRRRHSSDESLHDEDDRRFQDDQEDSEQNSIIKAMTSFILNHFQASVPPPSTAPATSTDLWNLLGQEEQSDPSPSKLAWAPSLLAAFAKAQERFQARLRENRSVNSVLPSVPKAERVANSPAEGRALKVDSNFFDLVNIKHKDSYNAGVTCKDLAALESSMRSNMESLSFMYWLFSAFLMYVKDNTDLDFGNQFMSDFRKLLNKSFDTNASFAAFNTGWVSLKRREAYLQHLYPSVTSAQKRDLLSDPLFTQRSLFSPTSVAQAKESARDVTVYQKAQPRASGGSSSFRSRPYYRSQGRGQSRPTSGSSQQSKKPSFSPRRGGKSFSGKGKSTTSNQGKNFPK